MGSISSYYFAYPEDNRRLYGRLITLASSSLWATTKPSEFTESTSIESIRHKLDTFYEDCEIFILEDFDEERYCFLALETDMRSPHVDGKVAEVALLASNLEDPKHILRLLRRIKEHCRSLGMDWLITHKHVAPYEYRARYHKL